MGSQVRIRHVAALGLLLVGLSLVVLVVPTDALAAELRDGLLGVAAADMRWLAATVLLLAASLTGTALAWRAALRACGVACRRVDAVARYGVGSLANAVLPTRIGGCSGSPSSRVSSRARAPCGRPAGRPRSRASRGPSGSQPSLRSPRRAACCPPGRPSSSSVWEVLGQVPRSLPLGRVTAPVRPTSSTRSARSATGREPPSQCSSASAPRSSPVWRPRPRSPSHSASGAPLAAGMLAVAAIEVVGFLPLSIGGAGMAGGAVAFALAAHGAAAGVPASAGLAFAAAETATALVVGGVGGVVLALPFVWGWLVRPVPGANVSLADE